MRSLAANGVVLLAGAYPEQEGVQPAALLLVRAESADAARTLLTEDPFQKEALVATVDVRPWAPPMGAWVEGDDERSAFWELVESHMLPFPDVQEQTLTGTDVDGSTWEVEVEWRRRWSPSRTSRPTPCATPVPMRAATPLAPLPPRSSCWAAP